MAIFFSPDSFFVERKTSISVTVIAIREETITKLCNTLGVLSNLVKTI